MAEEKFDYLVILNGLAINTGNDFNTELIELNWCSYDISNKSVNAESSYLIRPNKIKEINQNFLIANSINISDLEKADDLLEVLKKFNIFIFETYTKNNFSYAFITKDEWLLGTQLKREATQKGIKLGYNLDKYFNLISEFKFFYKLEKSAATSQTELKDLLIFLNLKQTEATRPSMMELNTLVRIVNRMIKDGNNFNFHSSNRQSEVLKSKSNTNGHKTSSKIEAFEEKSSRTKTDSSNNSKKIKSDVNQTSTSSNPILTWNHSTEFYFRIKNLPLYIGKQEIRDLFYIYDIPEEDIVLAYDIFGRKLGEAVIRVYSETYLNEIISCFKYRQYDKRLINIIAGSNSDFINCEKNLKFLLETIYDIKPSNIFVKIKNLNYSTNEETILRFFRDFQVAENGIKILRNKKGNFLGEVVVAFSYAEEAMRAIKQKNGETVFNSHVTLDLSCLNEFEEFAHSSSFYLTIKSLSELVIPEIVQRCLYVNNFPLDVDVKFLVKTFEVFNLNQSNFIFEERILMNYGCLIISFPSEEDASFAKSYLKKLTIKWKGRSKKLEVEHLLLLVNKGNEI